VGEREALLVDGVFAGGELREVAGALPVGVAGIVDAGEGAALEDDGLEGGGVAEGGVGDTIFHDAGHKEALLGGAVGGFGKKDAGDDLAGRSGLPVGEIPEGDREGDPHEQENAELVGAAGAPAAAGHGAGLLGGVADYSGRPGNSYLPRGRSG